MWIDQAGSQSREYERKPDSAVTRLPLQLCLDKAVGHDRSVVRSDVEINQRLNDESVQAIWLEFHDAAPGVSFLAAC